MHRKEILLLSLNYSKYVVIMATLKRRFFHPIEEKYSCYNYRKFVLSGEHADHKVRQPDISATDNAIGGRGRREGEQGLHAAPGSNGHRTV